MQNMYENNNLPWVDGPKRILKFLEMNKGKFAIDLPPLETYWPSYNRGDTKDNGGLQSIWQDPNHKVSRKLDSLTMHKNNDTDYLVCLNDHKTLRLNFIGMITLDLCDEFNSVSVIVSIIREAYPSGWQTIEYDTQSTIRKLYTAGFITDTRHLVLN